MSKNNLRGITLDIGPISGIHSLTLIISCEKAFRSPKTISGYKKWKYVAFCVSKPLMRTKTRSPAPGKLLVVRWVSPRRIITVVLSCKKYIYVVPRQIKPRIKFSIRRGERNWSIALSFFSCKKTYFGRSVCGRYLVYFFFYCLFF